MADPALAGGALRPPHHARRSVQPCLCCCAQDAHPAFIGWCLDTFLRYGQASLAQIDRSVRHQAGRWHAVALSFDGRTMTHYVDGVRELAGDVAFKPLAPGQTSIGVRLNRRSWFKGRIRSIRITPEALPADRLLKAGVGAVPTRLAAMRRRPAPAGSA